MTPYFPWAALFGNWILKEAVNERRQAGGKGAWEGSTRPDKFLLMQREGALKLPLTCAVTTSCSSSHLQALAGSHGCISQPVSLSHLSFGVYILCCFHSTDPTFWTNIIYTTEPILSWAGNGLSLCDPKMARRTALCRLGQSARRWERLHCRLDQQAGHALSLRENWLLEVKNFRGFARSNGRRLSKTLQLLWVASENQTSWLQKISLFGSQKLVCFSVQRKIRGLTDASKSV